VNAVVRKEQSKVRWQGARRDNGVDLHEALVALGDALKKQFKTQHSKGHQNDHRHKDGLIYKRFGSVRRPEYIKILEGFFFWKKQAVSVDGIVGSKSGGGAPMWMSKMQQKKKKKH
jgi:hypothetical protein